MTPEQTLRLKLLLLSLDTGVCGDCALDLAADFEAYVRDGYDEDEDASLFDRAMGTRH